MSDDGGYFVVAKVLYLKANAAGISVDSSTTL
jgi:hypothetical protein